VAQRQRGARGKGRGRRGGARGFNFLSMFPGGKKRKRTGHAKISGVTEKRRGEREWTGLLLMLSQKKKSAYGEEQKRGGGRKKNRYSGC